jgi:competence protein ComEA
MHSQATPQNLKQTGAGGADTIRPASSAHPAAIALGGGVLAVLVVVGIGWGVLSGRSDTLRREEAVANVASSAEGPTLPAAAMVNLNTATSAQLRSLPGVGAALAERIIEYRRSHGPFERVEQLDNVRGIGPATMARIRAMVYVE